MTTIAGVVLRHAVYCLLRFQRGKILRLNKLTFIGPRIANGAHERGRGHSAGLLKRLGPPMNEVTRVLSAVEQGDPHAAEQLLPLVYDELRKLAARRLAQEAPGQTLQATALVHEAYLRLVADEQ